MIFFTDWSNRPKIKHLQNIKKSKKRFACFLQTNYQSGIYKSSKEVVFANQALTITH